jgi:hypothetical protein
MRPSWKTCVAGRCPWPGGSTSTAAARTADLASPGGSVLLSPGFASFDLLGNCEDRGVQFEMLVQDPGVSAPSFR